MLTRIDLSPATSGPIYKGFKSFPNFGTNTLEDTFEPKPIKPEIQFPAKVVLGQENPLLVKFPIPETPGLPVEGVPLILLITSPNMEIVDEDKQPWRKFFAKSKEISQVLVNVKFLQLCNQHINLELFNGADRIGYYIVSPEVIKPKNS
jgi:hypothetical protein